MKNIKGWRTVAVSVGLVAGTAALEELAKIDWVNMVGPIGAMAIVAGINIGLRAITTSPIGKRW